MKKFDLRLLIPICLIALFFVLLPVSKIWAAGGCDSGKDGTTAFSWTCTGFLSTGHDPTKCSGFAKIPDKDPNSTPPYGATITTGETLGTMELANVNPSKKALMCSLFKSVFPEKFTGQWKAITWRPGPNAGWQFLISDATQSGNPWASIWGMLIGGIEGPLGGLTGGLIGGLIGPETTHKGIAEILTADGRWMILAVNSTNDNDYVMLDHGTWSLAPTNPPQPKPAITLEPDSFSFSGVSGATTPPNFQTLKIKNSGASGAAPLSWTATTSQSWCYLGSGTDQTISDSINVNDISDVEVRVAAPSVVGTGTHSCTITVSDSVAANGNLPQTVPVTYSVINTPQGVVCNLSVSGSPARYCDGILTWVGTSTPTTGLSFKWYGTKNGVIDTGANGVDSGNVTNFNFTDRGWTEDATGTYTRYFKAFDATGLQVCQSQETVTAEITNCQATATYVISPSPASKQVGQTQQFTGWYDSDGSGSQLQQDKTSSATWSSLNPSIATVTNSGSKGLATCVSAGTATVSSTYTGINAQTTLTCSVVGATTVSGYAKDSSNVGINSVDVTANCACAVGPCPSPFSAPTNSSGYYTITIPDNVVVDTSRCANASVSASKSSCTFSPNSPNVTLVRGSNVDQNFIGSCGAATYTLTVSKTPNTNSGTIVSNPIGISCGIGCASQYYSYISGATVVLTATPASGYVFSGWSGCDSVIGTLPNQTCNITMSSNKAVTATFGAVTTDQAPVAVATISKDGTTYANSITVTKGVATNIWLAADEPTGSGSFDPNVWTDATNGVSTDPGKCEWNSDLNQGAPIFEPASTVNHPASASACNISLGSRTFNDNPGTYTYSVLKITDKPGLVSNIASVSVTVQAAATHKECQNNACVSVSGTGSDLCSNDAQCGGGGAKYKCENNNCVRDDINGVYGNSSCDNVCGGGGGGHLECRNNACVAVPGVSANLCNNNTQCISCPSLDCSSYITNPNKPIITPNPSVLISGSPNPAEIQPQINGQSNVAEYTLDWQGTDTGACSSCLTTGPDGFSTAAPNGSQAFYKSRGNYKYDISCSGGHYCSDHEGNQAPVPKVSNTVTINVVQLPQCTFGANPQAIILPGSSTLNWNCYFAESCSINQGIGPVNLASNQDGSKSGSKQVRPSGNTTYTLTCSGLDGSTDYQTTVGVGFIPWIREILPR